MQKFQAVLSPHFLKISYLQLDMQKQSSHCKKLAQSILLKEIYIAYRKSLLLRLGKHMDNIRTSLNLKPETKLRTGCKCLFN